MQEHPVRERIYLPVVRFGVPHTDWKYVFVVTLAGFVLPFILNIRLYGIPVPMFTGTLALAASVAFFNFIRLGRRPLWFQHSLLALFTNSHQRAALPTDAMNETWMKEVSAPKFKGVDISHHTPSSATPLFRFEHL